MKKTKETPEQKRQRQSHDSFYRRLAEQAPGYRESAYDAISEEAKTQWLKGE